MTTQYRLTNNNGQSMVVWAHSIRDAINSDCAAYLMGDGPMMALALTQMQIPDCDSRKLFPGWRRSTGFFIDLLTQPLVMLSDE